MGLCGPRGLSMFLPREIPGTLKSGLTKAMSFRRKQHRSEQCPYPKFSIKPRKKIAFRAGRGCESLGFHLRACLVLPHPQERKGYRSHTA